MTIFAEHAKRQSDILQTEFVTITTVLNPAHTLISQLNIFVCSKHTHAHTLVHTHALALNAHAHAHTKSSIPLPMDSPPGMCRSLPSWPSWESAVLGSGLSVLLGQSDPPSENNHKSTCKDYIPSIHWLSDLQAER